MREVDDAHDAEHERQAAGDQRVIAAEQNALDDLVEEDQGCGASARDDFLQTEIRFGDLLSAQRSRRPFDGDQALEHADGAACGRHGALQVLLDQKHGDAGRFQRLELDVKAIDHQRRQAQRNLVEQQELRVHHQRAPDRGGLLLAARQCAGEAAAAILKVGKGLHDGVERPCARSAGGARELEILFDRQPGEQSPAFGNKRHAQRGARVRGRRADILALEDDAARRDSVRAGDRAQKRGLAGAVRADERNRLPFLDGQADAAHSLELAVAGFETFDGKKRHTTPPPR